MCKYVVFFLMVSSDINNNNYHLIVFKMIPVKDILNTSLLLVLILPRITFSITSTCTIIKYNPVQESLGYMESTDLNCTILPCSFSGMNLKLLEATKVELSFSNIKRDIYAYVNITASFVDGYLLRPITIYTNETQCFKIGPSRKLNGSGAVKIDFFELPNLPIDINVGVDEECNVLYDSALIFARLGEKSLRLEMTIDKEFQYNYTLMSGSCNITCNGLKNNCTTEVIKGQLPSMFLNKETIFSNLSNGYHCVRIGPDRCPIHSVTMQLTDDEYEKASKVYETTYSYYLIALLLFGFVVIIVIFVLKNLSANTTHLLTPAPEILLLYWNESPEFLDIMASFRKLLSAYSPKVWDPYCEDERENVSENMSIWLCNVMKAENLHIILVETDQAVTIEKMPNGNKLPSNYFDNIFLLALSMLDKNKKNVYIVRLSRHGTKKLSFPATSRYTLPKKLDSLITDLFRCSTLLQRNCNADHYRNILKSDFLTKLTTS